MKDAPQESQVFQRPLRERTWYRVAVVVVVLLAFGGVKLPIERELNAEYRDAFFHGAKLNLGLRQQIGQMGFLAALGGFRAVVADGLWIQAHIDWTRTEWGNMLLIFNNVTALQPRNIMFWDMSAWHMAYNASAYAMQDTKVPRMALRLKHQHEYFMIGKDLLERGIANNPDRYKLHESLANVLRDKLNDHCGAAEQYRLAAQFPDCPTYDKRFAAYELSYCPGHEMDAYKELVRLYNIGEKERLPTLYSRLKELQETLKIPQSERIKIPENQLAPHH
jgi:hypothetical protein